MTGRPRRTGDAHRRQQSATRENDGRSFSSRNSVTVQRFHAVLHLLRLLRTWAGKFVRTREPAGCPTKDSSLRPHSLRRDTDELLEGITPVTEDFPFGG